MEKLHISTITSVGAFTPNIKFNPYNLFNNININEFITFIESADQGYKGWCEKLTKKKRKTNSKRNLFMNMIQLILNFENKNITIKLFTNSKFQVTGGRDMEQGKRAIQKLLEYIDDLDSNYVSEERIFSEFNNKIIDYKVCLINSDINIEKPICRESLFQVASDAGMFCSLSTDSYPGCQIRYYYNKDSRCSKNGVCMCENICDGKGKNNSCGDGNCKKVTIAAFASGKILIHGAQSMEQIKEGYNFITKFISENKSEVILR